MPWFVAWVDGEPDFRVIDSRKLALAVRGRRCMVCGEALTRAPMAFTVGPMCAVNRISAEPPSHIECADFSVRACPFLSRPHMVRREAGVPAGVRSPGGLMLRRNPGVALLWITRSYDLVPVEGGVLFRMGAPTRVAAYAEGREATVDDLAHSVATGLPALEDLARKEGPDALRELERQTERALRVLRLKPAALSRAREAVDAA